MKRRIALLGPPASGKGAQAEMIAAHFGIPVVSPGAILREQKRKGTKLGAEAEIYTKQGRLLPDSVIRDLIRQWLDAHEGEFVFDGFPRSLGQAEGLEEMTSARGTPLEIVVALETDVQTLRTRMANRLVCTRCGQILGIGLHVPSAGSPCPKCGGELGRRGDDEPETLAARLIEYGEKTEPLLDYYSSRGFLRRINAAPNPELVFAQLSANLADG